MIVEEPSARPGIHTSEFKLAVGAALSILGGVVKFGVDPNLAAGLLALVAVVYIAARTRAKCPPPPPVYEVRSELPDGGGYTNPAGWEPPRIPVEEGGPVRPARAERLHGDEEPEGARSYL